MKFVTLLVKFIVKFKPTSPDASYDKELETLLLQCPTVTVIPTLLRVPDDRRHRMLVSDCHSVPSQPLPELRVLLLKSESPIPDPSTVTLDDPVPAAFD